MIVIGRRLFFDFIFAGFLSFPPCFFFLFFFSPKNMAKNKKKTKKIREISDSFFILLLISSYLLILQLIIAQMSLESVDSLIAKGNQAYIDEEYMKAEEFFTQGLELESSSILYSNRAAVYLYLEKYQGILFFF